MYACYSCIHTYLGIKFQMQNGSNCSDPWLNPPPTYTHTLTHSHTRNRSHTGLHSMNRRSRTRQCRPTCVWHNAFRCTYATWPTHDWHQLFSYDSFTCDMTYPRVTRFFNMSNVSCNRTHTHTLTRASARALSRVHTHTHTCLHVIDVELFNISYAPLQPRMKVWSRRGQNTFCHSLNCRHHSQFHILPCQSSTNSSQHQSILIRDFFWLCVSSYAEMRHCVCVRDRAWPYKHKYQQIYSGKDKWISCKNKPTREWRDPITHLNEASNEMYGHIPWIVSHSWISHVAETDVSIPDSENAWFSQACSWFGHPSFHKQHPTAVAHSSTWARTHACVSRCTTKVAKTTKVAQRKRDSISLDPCPHITHESRVHLRKVA